MSPGVYTFYDKEEHIACFRGFVKKLCVSFICHHELLQGHDECTDFKPVPHFEKIACKEVRKNRLQAKEDAKKLLEKIKGVSS